MLRYAGLFMIYTIYQILSRPSRPVWVPPSLLHNGNRVFPGVKVRTGHADDHLHPSSAEVLEEWSYTSTPSGPQRGLERGYFTFTFTIFIKFFSGSSNNPKLIP
jgi:hypothetical protein